MAVIKNHDLRISGGLRAGNWKFGRATVTPVANTPTSVAVSGLSLTGTGTTVGVCTASTSAPGSVVQETTVTGVTAAGMTLWIYRTNTVPTDIDWMMWRNRA